MPAYREAGVIAEKVADLRANGYPGELDVLVVAEDPETASAAERAGARVLRPTQRLGKAQALNLGVSAATTEAVVLTDANNQLVPGALCALVRWLSLPWVGAVAGEKVDTVDDGEALYWRFESWLKRQEARLGTTIGLVGELAAVRVEAWQPLPHDIAVDDLWLALDVAQRGWAVAYEPAARAVEPPDATFSQQWERRTRMVAGALHVFARRARTLGPSGGLVAAEAWGHRLWRYTVGPLAHVALVALAVRHRRTSRTARLMLAAHIGMGAALGFRAGGRRMPGPVAAGGEVLFLQVVAIGGLARFLRGDRPFLWDTPER